MTADTGIALSGAFGSEIPGATNIKLCGNGFIGHFRTMYDPSIYMIMHDALVK